MSELTFKGTKTPWYFLEPSTIWTGDARMEENNGYIVSEVYGKDRSANAHLIAAAPELLQELIELNVALDDYWNSYQKSDRLLDIVCKKQKLSLLAINKALNK